MTIDPYWWFEAKQLLEHLSGWSMDTLHVLAGVAVQLALAAILRCSLGDLRPWAAVCLLELANEAYDLWIERWPSLGMQLGEGLRDLVATLLLPTLLLWVSRRRPQWLVERR